MSIWTSEELERLNKAVRNKDHVTISNLVKLYQQRTNAAILKNSHPTLVAIQENNGDLLQYYLSNLPFDSKTLNNCIEISLVTNHLEVFQVLFARENQLKLGINPNSSIPVEQSLFRAAFDQFVDKISILHQTIMMAKKYKNYKILEFLLSLPNQLVDQPFAHKKLVNCTELLLAFLKNAQEPRDMNVIRLLLQHGADPYLLVNNNNGKSFTVISFIEDELKENPRDPEANEIMTLIKTELKNRGNRGRDSSPEHSSDSTQSTPRSVGSFSSSPKDGSPNGTPPLDSIIPDSPPRIPSSSSSNSSSSSLGGSPLQLSDSDTSGSIKNRTGKILDIYQSMAEELLIAANNDPDQALLKAITKTEQGNELEVQKILVDSGIKFKEINGMLVHHLAAYCGRFELLKHIFLKFPNIDINMRNKSGYTILHAICLGGNSLELLRFIMFKGYNPNAVDNEGQTPLHCVKPHGVHLVEELVLQGANPLITNKKGLTPLQDALEKYGDKPNDEKVIQLFNILRKVTEEKQKKQQATEPQSTISRVISASSEIQPNSSDTKPKIVLKVDKSLPKDKFEKRFYTRISPDTPIEQLKEYYFSGVTLDWYDPDDGGNAFHRAADIRSNFPVAEALLEWGVDINILDANGRTIIQRLAIEEHAQWLTLECLEFVFKDRPYIKKKPDIDYRDKDGNTALHLAVAKGANEVVDWLLKHDANPRITNGSGLSVEQYAEKCENSDKKTAIKAILKRYNNQPQSLKSSPAEIQYRTRAPVNNYYSSNNSSVIFSSGNRANSSGSALTTSRSATQQVGAVFAPPPPPLSAAQLPRPFKKPDRIIEPPLSAVVPLDNKKSTPNVVDKLKKGILGK